MAKRKPEIKMRSYGVYAHWDAESKELPRFMQTATRIQAKVGIEFGFIVNIKNCKNQVLDYCIDHPGILDDRGQRREPFDGTVYVKTNDWNFYLGDTIWDPIADKIGDWVLYLELDGNVVAEKTFELCDDAPQ
ncbi:DUF3859 domain-containing protein [Rubripirellula reticaptiva]|uniref:DUF3859 domain-containing protein n=1 Tax=Rubripirellula reticaptiva TaxID=2528013 RepID=A0A5C6EJ52_9BACT|nr:DUF3859 domain-containing protein [Rubripirellula reticaptiva]TWU47676.1 hypothetical protein Poly59_45170 [Rubripirellula reticaptiva]